MANIRGGTLLVAARTFSTKNSASLSALMPVETVARLCHVIRLIKITARARGHYDF